MLSRIVGAFVCILFTTSILADDAENPFTRDLLILTEWFEGEFDNEEQLWFHLRSRSEDEAPTRIHVTNKRVNLPAFGEHVFYVEEYRDNDATKVSRQRLVTFSSDLTKNAIRMRQGFFNEQEQYLGAHQNPGTLSVLSIDDVVFLDECDVFLRRNADQFQGGMAAKECVFGEGGERRYSVHDVTLSASKFWRVDATYLTKDDSFFRGTPPGKPTQLRRAKTYYCDFFFDNDDGEQQVVRNLRVHSQGGTATVVRESDSQSFDILIREKEYDYYASRPDFIYYSIRHSGERLSVAYGVADPNARQFGTKAGNVGAFCHREGYTFREPVEAL